MEELLGRGKDGWFDRNEYAENGQLIHKVE